MGMSISGEEAEVEAFQEIGWLVNQPSYPDYQDAQKSHNILYPATDPNVICVGATSYRTGFYNLKGAYMSYDRGSDGEVATYSSRGPTLAGLTKPDVLAPGTNIVAAFNSYYSEMNPGDYMTDFDVAMSTFRGREYRWSSQRGTSMACPIVAGIIAQWLEAIPTLTHEQVIAAFEATCHRHDPLLAYPNNDYGYGEIDAEAGLKYLKSHYDGMSSPFAHPIGKECIYDLQGRIVEHPSGGIYIVVDTNGNRRKILYRQ